MGGLVVYIGRRLLWCQIAYDIVNTRRPRGSIRGSAVAAPSADNDVYKLRRIARNLASVVRLDGSNEMAEFTTIWYSAINHNMFLPTKNLTP